MLKRKSVNHECYIRPFFFPLKVKGNLRHSCVNTPKAVHYYGPALQEMQSIAEVQWIIEVNKNQTQVNRTPYTIKTIFLSSTLGFHTI